MLAWLGFVACALASVLALTPVLPSEAQPVLLDATFTLTDLDYKPLAGVPVRLVFGSEPDWQGPAAGRRFVTDAAGSHRMSAPVVLDTLWRKAPTNFASSLLSAAQRTDHLMVAAELDYMTFRWLYVVDMARFASGDVMLDRFSVYTPDSHGRFTRRAKQDASGWTMADLGGLVLTVPGHEPWEHMLEPDPADPAGKRWRLKIAFKRSPAPVRR